MIRRPPMFTLADTLFPYRTPVRSVKSRVEAVRQVVAGTNEADDAGRRWKDATAVHERAWRAALDAGWSEKDLRATGARAPGQTNRPRRARTTGTRSSNGAGSASSEE